ncbi:MAG: glycosyltransferase [Gemmatimonadota bacterium]
MVKAGPPVSVLHVSSNRAWGGGENQVRLLMRELSKANVRQLCLCPDDSPLAERLRYLNFPIRGVSWRSGSDLRAFFAIARALRDFAIVHCHDAHALQLAMIPAKLRGVKIAASRRVRFKTSALKWNRADIVIAVSQTVRAELLIAGVNADKIRVIHSGTDLEETRAVKPLEPSLRQRIGLSADTFVAGCAAAFHPPKNLTIIPEAAALLPDVHWLIAGDGAERANIEAAIAGHNVRERVHLLGWLDDARPMLKELDAYVSTSLDDGLGNSITESLALRIPVIAADAGGPAEIMRPIHEQTNAVLFEPRNAAALVTTLKRLRDAETRKKVIDGQDERFKAFEIQRTASATLQLYHELLST